MLPYSLGGALASVPVAQFNDYLSKRTKDTTCYKIVIIVGLSLSVIGFGIMFCHDIMKRDSFPSLGLLILLDEKSNLAAKELYPLIAGIGVGMLFHAPFAALTTGMSAHDRSRTTSAFFLVRFIGATSGLVENCSPTLITGQLISFVYYSLWLEPFSPVDLLARCPQDRHCQWLGRLQICVGWSTYNLCR